MAQTYNIIFYHFNRKRKVHVYIFHFANIITHNHEHLQYNLLFRVFVGCKGKYLNVNQISIKY